MAKLIVLLSLLVVVCLKNYVHAVIELRQNPEGEVMPEDHVTFTCQIQQTTFLTWTVEIPSQGLMNSRTYLPMDPLNTAQSVGSFWSTLTNIEFDPIDDRIANFTSTLEITANFSLNPISVQCEGALQSQSAQETLNVSGRPGIPSIPTISSREVNAVLILQTTSPGVLSNPPHTFGFEVQICQIATNEMFSVRMNFSNYMSGEQVLLTVDDLVIEEQYQFAAQAYNQFGISELSNRSAIVTIIERTEDFEESGLGAGPIAGIVVGSLVIILLSVTSGVTIIVVYQKSKRERINPDSPTTSEKSLLSGGRGKPGGSSRVKADAGDGGSDKAARGADGDKPLKAGGANGEESDKPLNAGDGARTNSEEMVEPLQRK